MKKSGQPAARDARVNGFPALPSILKAAVLLLVFAARVRLLEVPLERDEGEYAYMGQLMLEGVAPYGAAANMKFPGTSAVFALFLATFGQSTMAIHAGLLAINALSVWLVFLLARRFFPASGGLTAAASFAVLASGWSVLGLWAHATHFVIAAALAGFVLLFRWLDSRRLWLLAASGICFGLSILMKQHGVFFFVLGAAYIAIRLRRDAVRPLLAFGLSTGAPLLVTGMALWYAGVFWKFWFWTFTYAGAYSSAVPIGEGISMLFQKTRQVLAANWAVWLLGVAGLALLLRQWRESLFPLSFLAVSFLAMCPGLYFREHYFILILPAVSLCAAALLRTTHVAVPWVAGAVLFLSVVEQTHMLFEATPLHVMRSVYGANPFPEAIEAADFIRANSRPDSTIAVLGSEPEIFFYSGRRSATPYLYIYPLMEAHSFAREMQEEFIREVEAKRPEFIVIVNVTTSWLRGKDSDRRLFEWWEAYGPAHYTQAGVVDVLPNRTFYQWDAAYKPRSDSFLLVLRRKD